MDGHAWRVPSDTYTYALQINNIGHGDLKILNNLITDWKLISYGWNIKTNKQIKIFNKSFNSQAEWLKWAKKVPFLLTEAKKDGVIQLTCKTRKKRGT